MLTLGDLADLGTPVWALLGILTLAGHGLEEANYPGGVENSGVYLDPVVVEFGGECLAGGLYELPALPSVILLLPSPITAWNHSSGDLFVFWRRLDASFPR